MDPELSLGQPYSMGERAFEAVCNDAREIEPKMFVEFGSGPSSVRLSQAFPDARLLSIDDSARFGDRARQLAKKHGTLERSDFSVRPLTWQWHAGALYQSYLPGAFPESIDVVIVDGPPGATRRGREAALRQAIDSVRIGGRIYLDDYRRPAERRIARNWMIAFPGAFRTWTLPFDHQVCVLEKLAPTRGSRVKALVVADVSLANLRRAAGWTWRRLRGVEEAPMG